MSKDGRSIQRDALEYLRLQAIKLWKRGKPIEDISKDFDVALGSVYRWIRTYKAQGISAMKKKTAKGATPKLNAEEIKELLKMLEKTADQHGFDSPLWDCKKITQLIKEKFNKQLHLSNVWRLLQRFELTAQKPERQATQRSEEAVAEWIKNVWPIILAHAKRWRAIVYFQDESGVSLTAVMGRTWSKKGVTPIVKVTGARGSICVTSAISQAGRMVFRIEKERIKAAQHIEFIQQVQKNHPRRKIIIIEDNARPHIAKEVKTFVETQQHKLAIYNIPSYAPDLNADEHVWAYLKNHQLKAHQAKTMKEFKPLVIAKMRSIQKQKKLISSFFYGTLFT